MELRGQIHASAVLTPRNDLLIPFYKGAYGYHPLVLINDNVFVFHLTEPKFNIIV